MEHEREKKNEIGREMLWGQHRRENMGDIDFERDVKGVKKEGGSEMLWGRNRRERMGEFDMDRDVKARI